MQHREVQILLYEYVRDELDSAVRQDVEVHLSGCSKCSAVLQNTRVLLSVLANRTETLHGEVDWEALRGSIMSRVEQERHLQTKWWKSPVDALISSFRARPGYMLAAGVVTVVLMIFYFASFGNDDQSVPPIERVMRAPVQTANEDVGRYFRQSRALLVGISNLDPPAGTPVDLSVEREVSRRLILEGRSLRNQNLDPRSSRLVGDVDKIMERVSQTPEAAKDPDLQTIRKDIRGQNLLVKLRVAESSYSNVPVVRVREGL